MELQNSATASANPKKTSELNRDELMALIDVSLTVNASLEWDEVLESIMSVTTEVMRVEASSLMLLNESETELTFQVTRGDKARKVKENRIKLGEGIAGWVARQRKPVIVHDVQSDPRFTGGVDRITGFHTKSILCVPMQTKKRLLGVIEIINPVDGRTFTEQDQLLCEAIANQAAIALENARLHEEKIKQERMASIGQTVTRLAHCIKNVLNANSGGAYIIDESIESGDLEKVAWGWNMIKRNNDFLQQLVLDMLNFAKEREPAYSRLDINDLCRSIAHFSRESANQNDIAIEFSEDPSIGTVYLDENGIMRCLMNLVGNALDACSKDGGKVRIETGQADDDAFFVIRVHDNGTGIPEENMEKLFKVFFSTKGSRGTGLGLPVTQKIIEEHGGDIRAESTPGKGTTFTVTLPKKPLKKSLESL